MNSLQGSEVVLKLLEILLALLKYSVLKQIPKYYKGHDYTPNSPYGIRTTCSTSIFFLHFEHLNKPKVGGVFVDVLGASTMLHIKLVFGVLTDGCDAVRGNKSTTLHS